MATRAEPQLNHVHQIAVEVVRKSVVASHVLEKNLKSPLIACPTS